MDPILGQIMLWPLSWVPDGWLACEGQELQVAQYQALYSLLGQTYGGNGSTTFKLPDTRGRFVMGAELASQMGLVAGNRTVTVPVPAHAHALGANAKIKSDLNVATSGNLQNTAASAGAYLVSSPGASTTAAAIYQTAAPAAGTVAALATGTVTATASGTTEMAGTPAAIDVTNPHVRMRYIIAVLGTYPMRPS